MNTFIEKILRSKFKINIIVAMLLWIICNIITAYFSSFILLSALGDQGVPFVLILILAHLVICIFNLIRFGLQARKMQKGWINFYPGIFIATIVIPQVFFAVNYILSLGWSWTSHLYGIVFWIGTFLYIIGLNIFFRRFFDHTIPLDNIEENKLSTQDWKKIISLFLIYISILGGILLFYRIQIGDLTSFCSVIIYQGRREYCYNKLAVTKQDLSICDKSGSKRSTCYSEISIIKNDLSICEQIPMSVPHARDYCYGEIAKIRRDISLCHKIYNSTARDSCYLDINKDKNDLSICDLIESKYTKSECYKNIK